MHQGKGRGEASAEHVHDPSKQLGAPRGRARPPPRTLRTTARTCLESIDSLFEDNDAVEAVLDILVQELCGCWYNVVCHLFVGLVPLHSTG